MKSTAAPCTIAKAYGEPYVNWATKVMLGHKLKDFQFKPRLDGYAIGARVQPRQVPERGQGSVEEKS